ncbi:MAG TPA: transposase [Rectinemataceae bacterium]|nr:transposase [Rectinemataceae bacterium]
MRKPRQLQKGARYHVSARINRKEMILEAGATKQLFLTVVKRAKAKYDFRIDNFCIMGNHFHLVIKPGTHESLSAIMQWILSVFAMAYNKIRNITGHVWGSRFFSRIMSGLRELMQVFEYIDENPVRSNQVTNRRDWRYGGLWHRRVGCRELVDELPKCLNLLFPEHAPLSLSYASVALDL